MPIGQQDTGATAGAKFVTSTVGNTLGGITNTIGGVVGAVGRGVGETIEGATGSAGRPVAKGLTDATNGIENGTKDVAGGVKRAGEWK
jgi:phage-related protein